jgi:FtsH-binding integral membrane protein
LMIAMLANMFFRSPAVNFAVSIIGVFIFTGLAAYYNQAIKNMYYVGDDGTVAGRKAILGALVLYISFVNLFLFLLQFLGVQRR